MRDLPSGSNIYLFSEMAFAGTWNKIAVDGVAGFAGVAGIPEDKLAAAGALIRNVIHLLYTVVYLTVYRL